MQTGKLVWWALILVTLPLAAGAAGLDIGQAKAAHLVGETARGYLAAVSDDPSSEVEALVDRINAQRHAEYERIAERNGITVADVEALAGKKAIEKTAEGGYIKLPGEPWRPK